VRGYAKYLLRALKEWPKGIQRERSWPGKPLEDLSIGHHRHVSVDERSAAKAGPLDDRNILIVKKLKKAQGIEVAPRRLQYVWQRIRKGTDWPFPAPLENADARGLVQFSRSQPRGGDRATVARTPDDEVLPWAAWFPRPCKHPGNSQT